MRERDDDTRPRSRSRSREREFARREYKNGPRNEPRAFKIFIDHVPAGTRKSEVADVFDRFGRVKDIKLFEKRNPSDFDGPSIGSQGHIVIDAETEIRNNVPAFLRERHPEWVISNIREVTNDDSRRFDKFAGGNGGMNNGGGRRHDNMRHGNGNMGGYGRGYPQPHQPGHSGGFGSVHGSGGHYSHHREEDDDPFGAHRRNDRMGRRDGGNYDRMESEGRGGFDRHRIDNHAVRPAEITNPIPAQEKFSANIGDLLQLPPERFAELTKNMNFLKEGTFTGSILVREIWIGNLPPNITEKQVIQTSELFGEIENVDLHNKSNNCFAFVRYKRVINSTKACENFTQFKNNLGSEAIKVSFSDHLRRKNIVGDSPDCEREDDLTPTLYIGFATGCNIASEATIRECLSAYGNVLFVNVKQSAHDNSARSYTLVEMSSLEEAKNIRRKMYLNDTRREKRARMGDKNAEICILIRNKKKEDGQPMINQKPYTNMEPKMPTLKRPSSFESGNAGNANNRFGPQNPMNVNQQFGNQKLTTPPHNFNPNFNRAGNANIPVMQQLGGMGPNFVNQQDLGKLPAQSGLLPHQQDFNPLNQQQHTQQRGNFGNYFPQQQPHSHPQNFPPGTNFTNIQKGNTFMSNMLAGNTKPNIGYPLATDKSNLHPQALHQYPGQGQPGFSGVVDSTRNVLPTQVAKAPEPENKSGIDFDELTSFIQRIQKENILGDKDSDEGDVKDDLSSLDASGKKEAPTSDLQKDLGEAFWSGFITRSKQHRVGVDAYMLKGQEITLRDFNLNVSYRSSYTEVTKKEYKSLVLFLPSNETQKKVFDDYITYFRSKERAGVVALKKMLLYLLPPSEEAFHLHKFEEGQLLGVFADENAKPTATKEATDQQPPKEEGDAPEERDQSYDEVLKMIQNPDLSKNLSELLKD